MLRQIFSASLATAIGVCAIVSSVSAQNYPKAQGYPYSSKQTTALDKKGNSTTVFLRKDGGVAGAIRKRSGNGGKFIPGKRSGATIILARFTSDRRVTRPAAPKPISDRVIKPIVKPPVFVPKPNREPIWTRGVSTRYN